MADVTSFETMSMNYPPFIEIKDWYKNARGTLLG